MRDENITAMRRKKTRMIKGNRVLIKPFETESEVKEYVRLYNDVSQRTEEDHLETTELNKQLELFQRTKYLTDKKSNYMILNEDNQLIGMIQWKRESDFEMTLGYRLYSKKYMSKGYMTEALSLFIQHIFSTYETINRLTLYIHEKNTPSLNLAKKLGFTFEGTMREAYRYRNKTVGFNIYSLLRKEYTNKS